jgi:hypothetical protein
MKHTLPTVIITYVIIFCILTCYIQSFGETLYFTMVMNSY